MKVETRLPYLKPEHLNPDQKKLYDKMDQAMGHMPYIVKLENGEMNGPSNAMLHDPEVGEMLFTLNRLIVGQKLISRDIHELVVLVVVSRAKALYGTYAHIKLAKICGLADDKIATITAGQRPSNMTKEETVAFDFASSLCDAGPISGMIYKAAVETFGQKGVEKLVWLIGMFKLVGTVLNAYNEPVSEGI
jgi:4-carboxymuconolactone decarboxylase